MDRARSMASDETERADIESLITKISTAQEKAARGFQPRLPETAKRSRDARPLLAPDDIRVDGDCFERLLAEVLGILEEWLDLDADGGRRGGVDLSKDRRGALLADAIEGGETLVRRGGELGLDGDVFALAVRCAFAPFLRACAQELGRTFEGDPDLGGRCPVCGAEPFMAEFDGDDGHRRLACGLCATRWRFARLKCPFCGNEDQKKLGFLEVEGFEGYRADVCESCRRYVKTIDRRRIIEQISLETAEVLTAQLDEAAVENGYGLPGASDSD